MSFTPIEQLWNPKYESFDGSYENVRRRSPHPGYASIVREATQELHDPRYLPSESSRLSEVPPEGVKPPTIFGRNIGEKAHMIPHSPVCAPTWAIVAQAIAGVDIEETYRTKGKKWVKVALQQLVLGKKGASRIETGMRYSPLNIAKIPPAHKLFFDDDPSLLIIPIFGSMKELKNWALGEEYWAVCITGKSEEEDAYYWADTVFAGAKTEISGKRELCSPDDIENAREILSQFVKAHADVLMGREEGKDLLKPIDLFYEDVSETENDVQIRKQALQDTMKILKKKGEVKIPVSSGKVNTRVMKVKLTQFNSQGYSLAIPDPAAVAAKAAVSWSQRCSQKLLPACPDGLDHVGGDDELRYERGWEQLEESYKEHIRPPDSPTLLAAALSGNTNVVTPEK